MLVLIFTTHDASGEMNFPHYVLNYENVFKEKVIDEFAESYRGSYAGTMYKMQ